jgi:hypothetical protein
VPSHAPGPDDGCETDIQSSATDCGRCEHDCLGGACLDGLCQPIVLATGEIDIFELAVGGGFVLWTVRNAVRRVRTTGATAETFDASSSPTNVVTYGASVIWIDANAIKTKSLGAPSSTPRILYEQEPGYDDTVSGLAANATGVFFALLNPVLTGETRRVSWIGGGAVYVGGDANNTRVLAVDDTYLYVQALILEATRIDGADGGAAIIIDQQRPVDIAVDTTHVYWGTQDAIKRWQKPAGDSEFVATETATVVSIAVDASNVYWSTADGHIRRAPKEGGAVETLVENQSSPRSVEVDDVAVYWANSGTLAGNPSSVLKVAK